MLILSQDKKVIVNTAHIIQAFNGGNSSTIRITMIHGEGTEIARYSRPELSRYALGMLMQAWSSDERYFEMPSESEVTEKINASKQCGIHVKTKANRHGGS